MTASTIHSETDFVSFMILLSSSFFLLMVVLVTVKRNCLNCSSNGCVFPIHLCIITFSLSLMLLCQSLMIYQHIFIEKLRYGINVASIGCASIAIMGYNIHELSTVITLFFKSQYPAPLKLCEILSFSMLGLFSTMSFVSSLLQKNNKNLVYSDVIQTYVSSICTILVFYVVVIPRLFKAIKQIKNAIINKKDMNKIGLHVVTTPYVNSDEEESLQQLIIPAQQYNQEQDIVFDTESKEKLQSYFNIISKFTTLKLHQLLVLCIGIIITVIQHIVCNHIYPQNTNVFDISNSIDIFAECVIIITIVSCSWLQYQFTHPIYSRLCRCCQIDSQTTHCCILAGFRRKNNIFIQSQRKESIDSEINEISERSMSDRHHVKDNF